LYNRLPIRRTKLIGGQPRMKLISPDGSIKEIKIEDKDMPIENLLKELGINPVEVIIAKNGKIVPEDETVTNEDVIKIIRVIHGG